MKMSSKTILITGGYGFIGSVVARKFHKQGATIIIVDNCSTGNKHAVPFAHFAYEMNVEDALCETIFKQHHIDLIIHCAAQTSIMKSMNDPIQDSYSNVFGVLRMLMWAQKYNVEHFVFTSSAAVYGDQFTLPITEEQPLNPLSVYGLNKQIGEMYCLRWSKYHNISTLILRLSNVYGPNSNNKEAIMPKIVESISKNKQLIIYGDGEQTRDYIYVEDIADAIVHAVENRLHGIFNISTNEQISLNALIEIVRQQGYQLDVKYVENKGNDIKHSVLANKKIIKAIEWHPTVLVKDGIQLCIEKQYELPAQLY